MPHHLRRVRVRRRVTLAEVQYPVPLPEGGAHHYAAIPTSVKVDVAIAAVLPLIGSMFVRKKLSHSPSHQHGYMHVYMNKPNIVQHNTMERTLKILRCFNCYLFVIILFAFTTSVKEVLLTPDVIVWGTYFCCFYQNVFDMCQHGGIYNYYFRSLVFWLNKMAKPGIAVNLTWCFFRKVLENKLGLSKVKLKRSSVIECFDILVSHQLCLLR